MIFLIHFVLFSEILQTLLCPLNREADHHKLIFLLSISLFLSPFILHFLILCNALFKLGWIWWRRRHICTPARFKRCFVFFFFFSTFLAFGVSSRSLIFSFFLFFSVAFAQVGFVSAAGRFHWINFSVPWYFKYENIYKETVGLTLYFCIDGECSSNSSCFWRRLTSWNNWH